MPIQNLSSRLPVASLVLVSAVLAACSSTKSPTADAVAPAAVAASAAEPAAVAGNAAANLVPHLDPKSLISTQRSVYFDFDSYVVKGDEAKTVELHGKYLAAAPNLKVRIEGNTDERGGSEYNLALGQKRAEAVVQALRVFGVRDDQAEAVSFGKERPKAAGHDEASWAQNRRADIAYPVR